MMVWTMIFLFQECILRFHVNLPGCNHICLFCRWNLSPTRPTHRNLSPKTPSNLGAETTICACGGSCVNTELTWLVVEPTPFEKYATVKLDSLSPRVRGENNKYLSCHQPVTHFMKHAFWPTGPWKKTRATLLPPFAANVQSPSTYQQSKTKIYWTILTWWIKVSFSQLVFL